MTERPTRQYHQLPDIISHQAAVRGSETALIWNGQSVSYGQLNARIQAAAHYLLSVANPGDRIAILSWNSATFVELLYAVPAAAMILVPLNARLAPAEWAYQLDNCGATLLLAQSEFTQTLDALEGLPATLAVTTLEEKHQWEDHDRRGTLPATAPADPAWLLYTSGSTGKPKGAVLSHQSIIAGLDSAMLGRPVLPKDIYYYPFPLFHVAAHNVLLQHAFGAAVMVAPAFNAAETLAALREQGVTTLSLAPTMISMLLDAPGFEPDDLAGVRTIGYGASAMPLTLLARLQGLSAVGLCQSYGMTELCGSIAFLTVEDHRQALAGEPQLLASVGVPLPTARVRIIDDFGQDCAPGATGEIAVQADQCFSYYWNNPDATDAAIIDGWLHTGDVGRFDERGYLYIVDRKKDMIISGGENVASREVEEVLRQHPNVKDCAVIGLPDPTWGERVAAVVNLAAEVEDSALETHCRALLAGYKIPRAWFRAETLPVNAGGKVDKPLLRARYAGNA